MSQLTVIIPFWHGADFVHRCMSSLSQAVPDNIDMYVQFIVNGGKLTHANYPKLTISSIDAKTDIGFARAVNLGLEYALRSSTDYVLVLNQDAYVDRDFFAQMLKYDLSDDTLYVPLIYEAVSGKISPAYRNWLYAEITDKQLQSDFGLFEVPLASGTAVFGSVEAWRIAGFFDPFFFMYYEDIDFTKRFVARGNTIMLNTGARVLHVGESNVSHPVGKYNIRIWKRNGYYRLLCIQRQFFNAIWFSLRTLFHAVVKVDFKAFIAFLINDLYVLLHPHLILKRDHETLQVRAKRQMRKDC